MCTAVDSAMITTIRWVLQAAALFALLTSCSSPLDDVAPVQGRDPEGPQVSWGNVMRLNRAMKELLGQFQIDPERAPPRGGHGWAVPTKRIASLVAPFWPQVVHERGNPAVAPMRTAEAFPEKVGRFPAPTC